MIDCVFVIMVAIIIASLLGAFVVAFWSIAWSLFEDTELGKMVIEKIRSWFGMDEE